MEVDTVVVELRNHSPGEKGFGGCFFGALHITLDFLLHVSTKTEGAALLACVRVCFGTRKEWRGGGMRGEFRWTEKMQGVFTCISYL